MSTNVITQGSRAVVISEQDGTVRARLFVNAQDGIQHADATLSAWKGKTIKGAKQWAAKKLA